MSLGNKIKQLRTEKGWTQGQLSEYSGVTRSYISVLESGKRVASPGSKIIVDLAKALEVDEDVLLQAAGVKRQTITINIPVFRPIDKPKSRIPDLPPDPPLEPELQAILDDPNIEIYFSKPYLSRLSNRQLRQIALNIKMMLEENEDRG